MNKYLASLLLVLSLSVSAWAQQTTVFTEAYESYKKGLSLYEKGLFGKAQTDFQHTINLLRPTNEAESKLLKTKAELNYAKCAVQLNLPDGEKLRQCTFAKIWIINGGEAVGCQADNGAEVRCDPLRLFPQGKAIAEAEQERIVGQNHNLTAIMRSCLFGGVSAEDHFKIGKRVPIQLRPEQRRIVCGPIAITIRKKDGSRCRKIIGERDI